MDVFFGWGLKFGKGKSPSVAMNADQDMVMVHVPSGHELAYRQGVVQRATVAWSPDQRYGDGREPSVGMSRTHALGVHRGVDDDRLFYELFQRGSGNLILIDDGRYDDGLRPCVAINDQGSILQVHKSGTQDRLWYRTGRISNGKVVWNKKDDFADGANQSISLNNLGQAIVVYSRGGGVYYRLVVTDGDDIQIHEEHKAASEGTHASVAFDDAGRFVLCYSVGGSLQQRFGRLSGSSVTWGGSVAYDTGDRVTVAAANALAVQVHTSEQDDNDFFTTSLILDRSHWMTERSGQLGTLPLRELVLPGSHDAGTYPDTISLFGKTQDKNIFQQLTYGARWFDLRIKHFGFPYSDLYAFHGFEPLPGAKLTEMLDDIRDFKQQSGGKELIILKFSHFPDDFTLENWNQMVKQIEERIGPWLYRGPLPEGKRLADLTLNEYNGAVLVVVDKSWAKDHPHPGFWIYRNWDSGDAASGHLRVFDHYSKTADYDKMRDQQIRHFLDYDGFCTDQAKSPCDLFLLSWTLTPFETGLEGVASVRDLAHTPNQHLGDEVAKLPAVNAQGRIINVAFVDFLQYARVSDVAIAEKNTGGAFG